MPACVFLGCPGHVSILETLLHGQQHIAAQQAAIQARLSGIETQGAQMTQEIDDVKTVEDEESAELATLNATVTRLVTDFEAKVSGATSLSDADKAELLAVVNEAKANLVAAQSTDAAVDAADPAPAPPAA